MFLSAFYVFEKQRNSKPRSEYLPPAPTPATRTTDTNSYAITQERTEKKMEERVEMVGRSFVDHYYHLFDNDRPSLSSLYQPSSMLTFEGQKLHGSEEIASKLINLPFDRCRHAISTVDCQPSSSDGGIIVFVSGSIQLAGEERMLRFSQMFHLVPALQGNFFVHNDIFRLNYG